MDIQLNHQTNFVNQHQIIPTLDKEIVYIVTSLLVFRNIIPCNSIHIPITLLVQKYFCK